ncbi:MAG: outer membrane protein transport protein [Kiritimatiellae bacterium]|jgi:long-subunit fatty acid transport protein|nr:outer membrane protein transport protein [Kiritimatiellia bacterium]
MGSVSLGKVPGSVQTRKKVEFEYPLYWALGSVWRWNNRLSTSFDVSQTWWSDYSFKEEGDIRRNPLDNSPYGEHRLDDCWSLRTGTEYLWVLKRTEIPFRAGVSWEQRPAIGRPDEYWGLSLGTGISLGKGPNKVIIDIAYTYTWANNVMGSLIPDKGIDSDVQRHDVYVSCIYHF